MFHILNRQLGLGHHSSIFSVISLGKAWTVVSDFLHCMNSPRTTRKMNWVLGRQKNWHGTGERSGRTCNVDPSPEDSAEDVCSEFSMVKYFHYEVNNWFECFFWLAQFQNDARARGRKKGGDSKVVCSIQLRRENPKENCEAGRQGNKLLTNQIWNFHASDAPQLADHFITVSHSERISSCDVLAYKTVNRSTKGR